MYFMTADYSGPLKGGPGDIVVLKARDGKGKEEILLAFLCYSKDQSFTEGLRQIFIETMSRNVRSPGKALIRAVKIYFQNQFQNHFQDHFQNQFKDPSGSDLLPQICGIICVDHTFFSFQNNGMIMMLSTRWGESVCTYRSVGEGSFSMESGMYEEGIGILLSMLGEAPFYDVTLLQKGTWEKSLNPERIKNCGQMERCLKEAMEHSTDRPIHGDFIWILPKEGEDYCV